MSKTMSKKIKGFWNDNKGAIVVGAVTVGAVALAVITKKHIDTLEVKSESMVEKIEETIDYGRDVILTATVAETGEKLDGAVEATESYWKDLVEICEFNKAYEAVDLTEE